MSVIAWLATLSDTLDPSFTLEVSGLSHSRVGEGGSEGGAQSTIVWEGSFSA